MLKNSKSRTLYISSEYQRLLVDKPEYQAAIDSLFRVAKSKKRAGRKDKRDREVLVQSWFEGWTQRNLSLEPVAGGIAPWWSDHEVADWFDISMAEITNEKRIEYARATIEREKQHGDIPWFEAVKVKASNGEAAYVVFEVQSGGQGGPIVTCSGIFRNLREFRQWFAEGWLDISKISDRRILALWPKS